MCTVAEVAARRRDSGDALAAMTQTLITAASAYINEWTDRRITPLDADPVARVIDPPTWLGAGGRELIVPDMATEPTAIAVEAADGITTTSLDLAGVVALPRSRAVAEPITRLRFRAGTTMPAPGEAVIITARYGYPQVPASVREAAIVTVVEWLKAHQSLSSPSPDQFEPGTPPARALPLVARNLLTIHRTPGAA